MSEKGFASLILLGFMPIVAAILVGYSFAKATMQVRLLPLQICRLESLRFQKETASLIAELQRTHPLVRLLRLEMIEANVLLAAGTAQLNPAVVARALQWIRSVQTRQRQLYTYQQAILTRQELERTRFRQMSRIEFLRKWASLKTRLWTFWKIENQFWRASAPLLPVSPDIPDGPGIFRLAEDFSAKQTSSISWSTEMQVNPESWFKRWIEPKLKIQDNCQASLWKEKFNLTEALWKKDKLSWRQF